MEREECYHSAGFRGSRERQTQVPLPPDEVLVCNSHQAERIIQFAIGQQAGVGGDARTVELQLEAAVSLDQDGEGFKTSKSS